MSNDLSMRERIQEFVKDAQQIVDEGNEALHHLQAGDEQAACDVISHAAYATSHLQNDWNGIIGAFKQDGVVPDGGSG